MWGNMDYRSFGKGFLPILEASLHFLAFFLIIIVLLWEIKVLQVLMPQEWIELISIFQTKYSNLKTQIMESKEFSESEIISANWYSGIIQMLKRMLPLA